MLTSVDAGPFTIRGVSVGGIYTSLHVQELDVLLDVGIAPRSFGAIDDLFLSHAHADHVGAITSLLGLRGLLSKGPLRIFLPDAVTDDLTESLAAMSRLQRYDLAVECVRMCPGSEVHLRADLWVRAFPTFHPVPSLGYQFFRRVKKLRPELTHLPGREIARRRKAGDTSLFYQQEHLELAYATDTLVRVLDETPSIATSRVLVIECSFLDERKSLEASRAGCHIHLDELLDKADLLENEHIVLMHFSQIYRPKEVREILERRCPKALFERIVAFAPHRNHWPG
jgi:ribonuclease Z